MIITINIIYKAVTNKYTYQLPFIDPIAALYRYGIIAWIILFEYK